MRHYSTTKPFPDSQLDAIVAAVENGAGSATLLDIAFALNPPPALRNVQRWLNALVKRKRLIRVGSTTAICYKLPPDDVPEALLNASPEGNAIQCLINQPLELRMVADYHRVPLESYSPNRTSYLPADVRARLAAPITGGNGTNAAQPWRAPAMLQKIAIDLAWHSGWLEAHLLDVTSAPLSISDVTACLAPPDTNPARPAVQLLWNQRAGLSVRLSRTPSVVLSYEVLKAVYAALTKGMHGRWTSDHGRGTRRRRGAVRRFS